MTELAAKLCEIGRRAYARGLVSGAEGNFSCRIAEDEILCTPSGLCKGFLTPADLCVVDAAGRRIRGVRDPSSEIRLHLAIYAAGRDRRDVRAVVHTHPPFATTFAVLGETLPAGMLAEADLLLGRVPLIPYETPGTWELARLIEPHVAGSVAAILCNHGAVSWGPDLESAYLRSETLESCCRVLHQARQIGTPRTIPPAGLAELWRRRATRPAPDAPDA